jgi:hypothetical protein
MAKPQQILPGARFGRLTVVRMRPGANGSGRLADVVCDCTTEKTVAARWLLRGKVVSCGCSQVPHLVMFNGTPRTIHDLAQMTGIRYATLYNRIRRRGWTPEKAVSEPLGRRPGQRKVDVG